MVEFFEGRMGQPPGGFPKQLQERGLEREANEVAPLMRDFLVFHGVPAAAIRVENASTSTRENALFTRKLLDGGSWSEPVVLMGGDYDAVRPDMDAEASRTATLRVARTPGGPQSARCPTLV